MAKPWSKSFYNSVRWKKCRDSYISQRINVDGGLCECCHDRLGFIVHHKTTLTPDNISDPYAALNHELLSYECKECHDRHEGHGVAKNNEPLLVYFDSNGDVVGTIPPP